jgi:lipoprotein-releasing system permease protein
VVKVGSFDDLDDKSILIGSGLAADLGVHVGDVVEVSSPLLVEELKKEHMVLPTKLTVVGIFETGWTVADSSMVAVTLRTMQKLYGLGNEVEAIEVRLDNDDIDHTLDVQAAIDKKLEPLNQARAALHEPPLRAQTWLDIFRDLMQVLWLEKTVMFYIMIFIVVVAAFSIASSLVTSVVRKTREIGMLGALGARPQQVAVVFCLQGFIIGLAGTLLGIGLAMLLLHYREPMIETFLDQRLIIKFYNFLSFPYQFRAGDFVKIIGFTLLITTLAGLLPAWRAARLKPAECLRYE